MSSAASTSNWPTGFPANCPGWSSADVYIPSSAGREEAMFYNLALNFNGFHAVLSLAVTMLFIVITLTKERNNERTRA
jgi:hypothetical protein